ncbi:MAG TPA: hypothetical protein VGC79_35660 [Polyangiaceae bacterium]
MTSLHWVWRRFLQRSLAATLLSLCLSSCNSDDEPSGSPSPRTVKVLIVTMFGPEATAWIDGLELSESIAVPGLSPDYPEVLCNSDDVCLITTGMGHANVAASLSVLVYSGKLDLTESYFLIAGIAGINPEQGTLASVAWARYLVDFGIAWEIDARELPAGWKYGYFGINTHGPDEKPPLDYRTEVFQLDEALLQKALSLSQDVELEDSAEAQAFRANYAFAPANEPPKVIQCDTVASDTWFAGTTLGERASDWTQLLTDGQGTYCTTQQEDNAAYEVLKRATKAGKLNVSRLSVLRGGSDFDRPYEGESSADNLVNYATQGGFVPTLQNLYNAGSPLIAEIVSNWSTWKHGVPK